jgi:hypothetical protein
MLGDVGMGIGVYEKLVLGAIAGKKVIFQDPVPSQGTETAETLGSDQANILIF